ncbi:MAG TPA: BamA/TamA family outer membrane protein, partial [Armatimonadota bacterium]|nr:BamA/TamA family outer membrane protein [Armatimonadota bacterium]
PEGTVKIPVAEGWIESIKVSGNAKTKANTLLRELDTRSGDVFCTKTLREDLQRLRNLDFFENINFQPAEGSEPGKVALVVDCKEKKTGTVSVGLGYSSRDRLVGFADISEHNFRGIGQQIDLRWEAGQFTNRTGYELSFTDPWMLGKRTSLGFSVYDRTTNRQLVVSGDNPVDTWIYEQRRGASISVGRPIGNSDRLLVDLRSDDVGYNPVDGYTTPPAEYLVSEGRVNSVTLRGIRNTRDIDINPHRGCLYSTSAEFAGKVLGGEWAFTKLGTDLRRYFPVGKAKPDGSNQKVLAVRLMGGFSLGNLPLSENYWIGGSESLRGYREDEFHGDRMLLLSSEMRVPFGANLQGVTFFDCGYAWPDGTNFSLGDLKPAVGVGLRVVTPLGPLRLDYGYGKEGGRSHFSIGHVF